MSGPEIIPEESYWWDDDEHEDGMERLDDGYDLAKLRPEMFRSKDD